MSWNPAFAPGRDAAGLEALETLIIPRAPDIARLRGLVRPACTEGYVIPPPASLPRLEGNP